MEKGKSRSKDMKKYLLTDSEAGWYKPCGTLDEAAAEVDARIAETDGDCTIQLFERAGGRRYKPIGAEMTIR